MDDNWSSGVLPGAADGVAAFVAIRLPTEYLLTQIFRSSARAERERELLRNALASVQKDWPIVRHHILEDDLLVVEFLNASVAFNCVAPTLAGLLGEIGENGRYLQIGLVVGPRAIGGMIVSDDIIKASELSDLASSGVLLLTEAALKATKESPEVFTPIGRYSRFRERIYLYIHRFRAEVGGQATPETLDLLSKPTAHLGLPGGLTSKLVAAGFARVGDVVTASEGEVLRVPGVGATALTRLKRGLWQAGGLELGMPFADWQVHEASEGQMQEIAKRIAAIGQSSLGARFEEFGDVLHIAESVEDGDEAAARQAVTQQLHADGLRKLQALAVQVVRLDNQPGWAGIAALTNRFVQLLDHPTTNMPHLIGAVYSSALELGSFLEYDDALRVGLDSVTDPLAPELRRGLEDCVRTLAPWVRRFPSARELDDEAGQFLVRAGQLSSARQAVAKARAAQLIDSVDSGAIEGLLKAGDRGDRVGRKAAARGVTSGRNLVVATAGIVAAGTLAFYKDAISSDFATRSELVKRAGAFLAAAESEALLLLEDMPVDLRLALRSLLESSSSGPAASAQHRAGVPRRSTTDRTDLD